MAGPTLLGRLYRFGAHLLAPAVLARRRRRGKEHPTRWTERTGIAAMPRPDGRLLWFHAASVGESVSVLALLDAVAAARPDATLLLTTGTVTSAELMARRLPPGVLHQFAPIDRCVWVERFLDHWRPDAAILVESELWPNLLTILSERKIPSALVNARLSEKSARNWRRFPASARTLLGCFGAVLAQSDGDAERWRAIGAANVQSLGNLKFAAPKLPDDEATHDRLRLRGKRPAWCFTSTHPGEEAIAIAVHKALVQRHPDLLTVIVPRHPHRGEEIIRLVVDSGLDVTRHDQPGNLGSIHVIAAIGQLGAVYRAVPIAMLGGSLVPVGGHNPIEPAQLGAAVLFGPHMQNFAEVAAELTVAAAAATVADQEMLIERLGSLLKNKDAAQRMGEAGRAVAERNAAVLPRLVAALQPVLQRR